MNLALFEPGEINHPLSRQDPRADHVLRVLGRKVGETFDVGLVDGPRGKATLVSVGEHDLGLAFAWGKIPPPLDPITLLVGLPRPQTARDILRDAATLGVGSLHFVTTAKGESSYAQSSLWSTGEWRRHVLAGVAQAFDTRVPVVSHGQSLASTLAGLTATTSRLALDNYEATNALSSVDLPQGRPVIVAIGPERGWSARDREQLRAAGFSLVHLGPRVLRTESACLAALAILKSRLGLF